MDNDNKKKKIKLVVNYDSDEHKDESKLNQIPKMFLRVKTLRNYKNVL